MVQVGGNAVGWEGAAVKSENEAVNLGWRRGKSLRLRSLSGMNTIVLASRMPFGSRKHVGRPKILSMD